MAVIGNMNAVLKDLTVIAEDQITQTQPDLSKLICSTVPEDGAYTRVPVEASIAMMRKFEGERQPQSKSIPIIINYNQDTYELTLDFDSDMMKNAKAYNFSDMVKEATMSAQLLPSYMASQMVINGTTLNGYDGNTFYNATHKFANTGTNNINNTVGATGTTVTAIASDIASATTKIRTFLDNEGRLCNQIQKQGPGQYLLHYPAALDAAMRQIIFGSTIPISAPVTTSGTAAATVSNSVLSGIADVFPDGYLDQSSPTTWYLHYVGMPRRPFTFIENYGLTVDVLGYGSEFQINNKLVRIALSRRFVLGYYRLDRSIKVA